MIFTLLAVSQNPTAPAVLKKVADTYRNVSSYEDSVEITTVHRQGIVKQSYKTWFVRPGNWRVDYAEIQESGKVEQATLWANPTGVWIWNSFDHTSIKATTIELGFSSLATLSFGFLDVIPSKLAPIEFSLDNLGELVKLKAKVIPNVRLAQTSCLKITGSDYSGTPYTVWIDQKRFLVLRIMREVSSTGGKAITTVSFSPKVNVTIPSQKFEFKPPK